MRTTQAARHTLDGRRVEDRRTRRASKRLMVRFGQNGSMKTGFTRNISESGVFLHTNAVYPPGSTVSVEIHFPGKTWSLWAKVAWAKKVPPQLSHLLDCGMGLQFVEPGAEWLAFFADWKRQAGAE
jgi:Tfp pilus assembly protein PilZ